MSKDTIHPFISRLYMLAEAGDRGALAALRRGLGQPPGTTAEMFAYVEPFNPPGWCAWVYYLIASLFAFHPKVARGGNMGTHMAAAGSERSREALERRFTTLLAAHREDLPDYLRQAVSFLKSKDVPVNWNQLFLDLQRWQDEERTVQRRWAREFWSQRNPENEENSKTAI